MSKRVLDSKNVAKFAKGIKTLNAKNEMKNLHKNIEEGDLLGEGGFGEVRELKSNKDYGF